MATVTVGCKLPHGMVMELGEKSVTLKGSNTSDIIGGHGITQGVDKSMFEEWMKKHADKDFVRNKLVFAHEGAGNTAAQAKDQADNKTGLEPLDPNAKVPGIEKIEKVK